MIDVIDPADGTRLGAVPDGGPREADAAIRAARAGQRGWARLSAGDRAAALLAAAAAVRARAGEIARMQSRENGRPLPESLGGVMAGVGTLEEYAHLAPLTGGRTLAGAWDAIDLSVREPRGVVVALVPWRRRPCPRSCSSRR